MFSYKLNANWEPLIKTYLSLDMGKRDNDVMAFPLEHVANYAGILQNRIFPTLETA